MCRCSAVGCPFGQTMSQTLMRSVSSSFVALVRGKGGGRSCWAASPLTHSNTSTADTVRLIGVSAKCGQHTALVSAHGEGRGDADAGAAVIGAESRRSQPVIGLRQGYGQTSPKLQRRRALPSAASSARRNSPGSALAQTRACLRLRSRVGISNRLSPRDSAPTTAAPASACCGR